jgi:rare lipoprotein A (peptidoglycan hydrolase)
MSDTPRHIAVNALVAAATTFALVMPGAVLAAIEVPPPPPVQIDETDYDDATKRVLELERMITDLKAEQTSIETRTAVTAERIAEQSKDLAEVKRRLKQAQDSFNDRAVGMYMFSGIDAFSLLLDSHSFSELMARATAMTSILEVDQDSLQAATVVAAQADFESGILDELRAEETELKALKDQRLAQVQTALSEQQLLITRLTPTSRRELDLTRVAQARTRRQWEDASVPLTARIRKVPGKVLPYTDRTYLVSEYHPRTFKTTGVTYNAVCSWYGPGFNGKQTASGQIYNQNDFTCASRNLPFGTWLALTKGSKRIVVVVNDRGPYVAGRDLDLSAAAARTLGFWGVETIGVEVVKSAE